MAKAMRRPVTLTRCNKPRLVLLNIEDYARLTMRVDPRKVHAIKTIPDGVFDAFKRGAE